MMFAASWAISAHIYRLFQRFAPSNVILRRVHACDDIKWGPLVGLVGVIVCGLLMAARVTVVDHGGPGWGNLVVVVAFWDAVKFAWLIPVSLIRLLRVRHQARVALPDWQHIGATNASPLREGGAKAPVAAGEGVGCWDDVLSRRRQPVHRKPTAQAMASRPVRWGPLRVGQQRPRRGADTAAVLQR